MSLLPFEFNFKNPNYLEVIEYRTNLLNQIRSDRDRYLPALRRYYRDHPAQFITDWGCTSDPRNVERGLPTVIPFILFERQVEWTQWFLDCWKGRRPGLVDKSREMGLSWLTIATAVAVCTFNPGVVAGFGSRKEEYVDKIGDPKSLFEKARQFIRLLPVEFRPGWDSKRHAPHMRIKFPGSDSVITGEAGDGIGRGDRTSFYFVDEAAWLNRPELVEASLSQTTNCRIDVSTPRGKNNPFARKRFGGKIDVFSFHWRDDPRKDDAWYQKQCDVIDDPVVIAQEIDIDYSASIEGIVIPSAWVQASIDAHLKLGITPTGIRKMALDVADEGKDANALTGRHGILIEHCERWSGKGSDIFSTVERTVNTCDIFNCTHFDFDADGLGAGVKGDIKQINTRRVATRRLEISTRAFRGSGKVMNPKSQMVPSRRNEDYFANAKAQAWWSLRLRFLAVYRAVVEGQKYDPDKIISISSAIPDYLRLVSELSQPTFKLNDSGKILIDKTPDGMKSPNLADSVMICFAPQTSGLFLL